MSPVIRVINLERSKERLAVFQRNHPGLRIERFPAVDGQALTRSACIEQGLVTSENQYTMRALAIAASHRALWQQAAMDDVPFHIAEDDAICHPEFAALAPSILSGLGEWDIVYWGWNFDWPMEIELAPGIGSSVVLSDQPTMRSRRKDFLNSRLRPSTVRLHSCAGIAAYSISPRGAQRYLERCLPIANVSAAYALNPKSAWSNTGLDVEMSRHHAQLEAYVTMPPLAIFPNDHSV